jgi:hypothetical protein
MRLFKLNAALLALIFSIVAGVLFFFVTRAFGHASEFGTPLNFINWFFFWFLESPGYYLPRDLGEALCVPFCFLQLWLMFLVGIVFTRYVSRKNNPKIFKTVIAFLTIALIALFGFLIYSRLWQYSLWKEMVASLASEQGYQQAEKDFQAGKLKILLISGDCREDKYSGTNYGPFEVWTVEYDPSAFYQYRYSVEKKVEYYNLHMRSKYEWSLTHTNSVKSVR